MKPVTSDFPRIVWSVSSSEPGCGGRTPYVKFKMENPENFAATRTPGEPFLQQEAELPPRIRVRLPGQNAPEMGWVEKCLDWCGRHLFQRGARVRRYEFGQVPAPGLPDWLTSGLRFRPRGRMTRTLESYLREVDWETLAGGQTSSKFSVSAWMGVVRGRGGKVVGYHRVESEGSEEKPRKLLDTMVILSNDGDESAVSLGLLAKLSVYAAFRQRSHELVLALRARAAQYAKEMELEPEYLAVVLPATVTLAHHVGRGEERAWRMLGGLAGQESQRASDGFASGVVEPVGVVWPVVTFVFAVVILWSTYDVWIGERAGWLTDGWGLLGRVERLSSPIRGWVVARRVTGPFGLSIHRGPAPVLVLTYAIWILSCAVTLVWACWPRHLRDRLRLFGRSGRGLVKGGK